MLRGCGWMADSSRVLVRKSFAINTRNGRILRWHALFLQYPSCWPSLFDDKSSAFLPLTKWETYRWLLSVFVAWEERAGVHKPHLYIKMGWIIVIKVWHYGQKPFNSNISKYLHGSFDYSCSCEVCVPHTCYLWTPHAISLVFARAFPSILASMKPRLRQPHQPTSEAMNGISHAFNFQETVYTYWI